MSEERAFKVLEEYPYLNEGYVRLINVCGNDEVIVMAARTSYGDPNAYEEPHKNEGLIMNLMEHQHTSPFELCNITLQIQLPLFVNAQLKRHRTARQNEMSARYRDMIKKFWIPSLGRIGIKSKTHKQGTGALLPEDDQLKAIEIMKASYEEAWNNYQLLLTMGVANEIARAVLPVGIYTIVVWQLDLNNLFKFTTLRLHPGAQQEISDLAEIIAKVLEKNFPVAWKAYMRHIRNGVKFSQEEYEALVELIACSGVYEDKKTDAIIESVTSPRGFSKRKTMDFKDKIIKGVKQ
jgi:thymidylate synthase (FAD)